MSGALREHLRRRASVPQVTPSGVREPSQAPSTPTWPNSRSVSGRILVIEIPVRPYVDERAQRGAFLRTHVKIV